MHKVNMDIYKKKQKNLVYELAMHKNVMDTCYEYE